MNVLKFVFMYNNFDHNTYVKFYFGYDYGTVPELFKFYFGYDYGTVPELVEFYFGNDYVRGHRLLPSARRIFTILSFFPFFLIFFFVIFHFFFYRHYICHIHHITCTEQDKHIISVNDSYNNFFSEINCNCNYHPIPPKPLFIYKYIN